MIDGDSDEDMDYFGYALDMKRVIRMMNVNLLTGVFDLSYTLFADYIHNPKYGGRDGGRLKGKRDYRVATYEELKEYRVAWDEYQTRQQDQRRASKAQKARGKVSSSDSVPKTASAETSSDKDRKSTPHTEPGTRWGANHHGSGKKPEQQQKETSTTTADTSTSPTSPPGREGHEKTRKQYHELHWKG